MIAHGNVLKQVARIPLSDADVNEGDVPASDPSQAPARAPVDSIIQPTEDLFLRLHRYYRVRPGWAAALTRMNAS